MCERFFDRSLRCFWTLSVLGKSASNRDVLLVVKGVPYLVDLWPVETALEHDESDVPKDIR